jgi:hypothetical protein
VDCVNDDDVDDVTVEVIILVDTVGGIYIYKFRAEAVVHDNQKCVLIVQHTTAC